MDYMRIGKRTLSFLMAITVGLSVGLRLLKAHSPDVRDNGVVESSLQTPHMQWNTLLQRLNFISSKENPVLVPVSLPEVDQVISSSQIHGVPFAAIVHHRTYTVDQCGRVLMERQTDGVLPVITATDFYFDLKSRSFGGEELQQALQFLQTIRELDPDLYHQISELHIDPQIGLLVYFASVKLIPVIVGRGNIQRKAISIQSLWEQFGTTDVLSNVRYLDSRYAGQIVLKQAL